MLERFGEFIVRRRWWVVAVWVIAAMAIISLCPTLASVESSDQTSFLPNSYESVQAQDLAKKAFPSNNNASDIIVFKEADGSAISQASQKTIQHVTSELNDAKIAHVESFTTSTLQLSPNHKVQLTQVVYDGQANSTKVLDAAKAVRDHLKTDLSGTGLKSGLTGEVAIGYDTQDSFNAALQIVGIATIVLIIILPAVVFRSPFVGLLPVLAVGLVYSTSSSLLAEAANIFDFKVSQQLSVLFTVVLYGVGTDYILFLLFRYRERLRSGDHTRRAVAFALSRASEAIFSAALVVISSFVALFFAKFGIFTSFAPGLVISVAVMLIAAMTLVPALVAIIGEKLFWPSKSWMKNPDKTTVAKRLGGLVSRRPGMVVSGIIVFLLVLSAGAIWYKSDFSAAGQPPAKTESATAYADIQAAFPAGVLSPTQVYISSTHALTKADTSKVSKALSKAQGVASVMPTVLSKDGKTAVVSVVLKDNPYSSAAIAAVKGPIRTAAHTTGLSARVVVGGGTAAIADVEAATNRDLRVVFPIAALFILVILTLLLRSVVAPLYLLLSVSLGFVATLGASTLVFTKIGSDPGLIFFLPILLYVFVVAIGTDYNILTITRLREEIRQGHHPRRASELTIEHSSATVTSAGLILAGTFASLLLAGIGMLTQMGFAIAIGVILSAYIIAPLLIPSISALLGYSIWWPGHKPNKHDPSIDM